MELEKFIKARINITEQELQPVLSRFKPLLVNKGKFVLKKGQVATQYYFIRSGGLRVHFNNKDKSITGWLAFEGEFFTELASYKSGTSTRFNIEAIEQTELLTISKINMEELFLAIPQWQQFVRVIWEEAFLKVIDGILSFQTLSAEKRYLAAMQQPGILQRVPLQELSTYLGITATSLSRIRKKIR